MGERHSLSGTSRAMLSMQIAIGVVGFALLFLFPPPSGRLLLIPASHQAARQVAALAVSHNALLVEEGPLPGSFVVFADRASLVSVMLRHGILITAAPRAGCGAAIRRGGSA